MFVIRAILHHVQDDVQLSDQIANDIALSDLMRSYNTVILEDFYDESVGPQEELFPVSGESFGVTIKDGIARLPVKVQHKLLNTYLQKGGASHLIQSYSRNSKAEIEREERQLKNWVTKFKIVVTVIVSAGLIVAGAIVAIMVKDNKMPDNALVKTLMGTATEIIKVLFNSK